jgi:NTP pyrophosphatase (non-canonical NTP hydrolase)
MKKDDIDPVKFKASIIEYFSQAIMDYKPGSTAIYDKALEWCKEYYGLRLGMVLMMANAAKIDMQNEYDEMIKSHARKIEQDFIKEINKRISVSV